MIIGYLYARAKKYREHKQFMTAAFWIGFFSSVIYRQFLLLMPLFLGSEVWDLNKNGGRWLEGYVVGSWAFWAAPVLYFTVVRAWEDYGEKSKRQ